MSPGMRSYETCGLMRQMNPGEVLASDQNHPEISFKTMAAFEPILFGKGDYFLHDENVKMKLSQYCHVPVNPEMVGRLEKSGYWLVLYRKRYNRSNNGVSSGVQVKTKKAFSIVLRAYSSLMWGVREFGAV
ncbi:hypothetical protein CsatA_023310 [Cannabis sativa]|uniref:Uncharacterized protein n=1 Tax=Cannabis sativa TaxID=3483 RepID=A0A803QGT4_CANSA